MPRVHAQKKSKGGKRKPICGRAGCGHEIQPGETYFKFEFRYGGFHFRCKDHYPLRSELTQSKMAEVYAAIEDAETSIAQAEAVDDVNASVQTVGETVSSVASEYRDAAEAMGSAGGENEEKADALEGWAQELESWEADVSADEPDFEEQAAKVLREEGHDEEDEAEWASLLDAKRQELEEEHTMDGDVLEQAREQANEILSQEPF